jgi:glycosyl transferase family 2
MIAFGSSITMPEVYERAAGAGIARVAEPDSRVLSHAAAGSLARSYNLLLDEAVRFDDLEALVLVHQDAEITDPAFCAKVRAVLADPEVGVAGALGAVGASSIAWWEAEVTWASLVFRYGEMGGGEVPAPSFNGTSPAAPRAPGVVDSLYGFVLVLAPWTVRNLRFDEALGFEKYGYDFDLCRQVRAAGRKVVAADLQVTHHHSLDLVAEPEAWTAAHVLAAEKWDSRVPAQDDAGDEDWRRRAREAEADAAGARLLAASWLLLAYATAQEHDDRLLEITATRSWRLTEPLRRLNLRLAARRARPEGRDGA